MNKLRNFGLFSGIGGMELGLERTGGFETVGFCEIDPFCQKILAQHFLGRPIIEDVKNVTNDTLGRIGVGSFDSITAGFPCQPVSKAGKQLGESDPRYLWPEVKRIISEFRPRYVLLENVPGLLSNAGGRLFGRILGDLALCGYDAEWQVLPASAFGAWHRRDRVWVVAYPMRVGHLQPPTQSHAYRDEKRHDSPSESAGRPIVRPIGAVVENVPDADGSRRQTPNVLWHGQPQPVGGGARIFRTSPQRTSQWDNEPQLARLVDGIPDWVDRIKATGNAVVPQIVTWIGEQILEAHRGN